MAAKVIRRFFIAFLVTALVAGATPGGARSRYRVSSKRIAPGVTLKRIHDRRGPNRIRVLTVNPLKPVTFDVALATEEIPGHEQTTSMARRHGALAAINGDFTVVPGIEGAGRPVNTFIEDGRVKASPLIWGRNFSISHDELISRVGHTRLQMWLTPLSATPWEISAVNPVHPDRDAFTMYTPAGGKTIRPPRYTCAARLWPVKQARWNKRLDGVTRDLVADDVICRTRRVKRQGAHVLMTGRYGPVARALRRGLAAGDVVSYGWSFNRPGVLDTIGGNPDLLENGRIVVGECEGSYFCHRNPRTGVGIRPDGKILMVTVDGRSRSSVGMTLWELARLFRYLGVESAINLDGGGSTTMVVRDRIVNVPSGGYERPVGSALLLLPGADEGEREPAPYVTPGPAPTPTPDPAPTLPPRVASTGERTTSTGLADSTWVDGVQAIAAPGCQALLDPGSTGGMLDAVARGDIASKRPLSSDLIAALQVFRGNAICE